MTNSLRTTKSHFGGRWSAYKINRKNKDQIFLLEDRFILSNLVSGKTLAINCLGEVYSKVIDIDCAPQLNEYSNILLINNVEFKYKTVSEVSQYITQLANTYNSIRIIANINLFYLHYDRINQPIADVTQELISQIGFQVHQKLTLQHVTHGFGHIFLALTRCQK